MLAVPSVRAALHHRTGRCRWRYAEAVAGAISLTPAVSSSSSERIGTLFGTVAARCPRPDSRSLPSKVSWTLRILRAGTRSPVIALRTPELSFTLMEQDPPAAGRTEEPSFYRWPEHCRSGSALYVIPRKWLPSVGISSACDYRILFTAVSGTTHVWRSQMPSGPS